MSYILGIIGINKHAYALVTGQLFDIVLLDENVSSSQSSDIDLRLITLDEAPILVITEYYEELINFSDILVL